VKRLFNLFLAVVMIFSFTCIQFMPRMELAGLVTLMVAAGVWGMRRVMAVGTPETKGCV